MQQAVLRLLHQRRNEVQAMRHCVCLGDLLRTPLWQPAAFVYHATRLREYDRAATTLAPSSRTSEVPQ